MGVVVSESELIELVLGDRGPAEREGILDDLRRNDASWSAYGWHEYLPTILSEAWGRLDMGQKLVALVTAEIAERYKR